MTNTPSILYPYTGAYMFTPGVAGAGTLDLSAIPSFNIQNLISVESVLSGRALYKAGQPGNSITLNGPGNVITFAADTTAVTGPLRIEYYDPNASAPAVISGAVEIEGGDGTLLTVKTANTPPAMSDTGAVVSISPNTPQPRDFATICATEGRPILASGNNGFTLSIGTGVVNVSVGAVNVNLNETLYLEGLNVEANFYGYVTANVAPNAIWGTSLSTPASCTPTACTVIPCKTWLRNGESTTAQNLGTIKVSKLRNADGTDAASPLTTGEFTYTFSGYAFHDLNFNAQAVGLFLFDSVGTGLGRTAVTTGPSCYDQKIRNYFQGKQDFHSVMYSVSGNTTANFLAYYNFGLFANHRRLALIVYELMINDSKPGALWGTATASFAGNVMTVTGTTGLTLGVNTVIYGASLPAGTYITALGTGTGGNGTYTLNSNVGTISSQSNTTSNALQNMVTTVNGMLGRYPNAKVMLITASPLQNYLYEQNAIQLRAAWVNWVAANGNTNIKVCDLGQLNGNSSGYSTTAANYNASDSLSFSGCTLTSGGVVTGISNTSSIVAGSVVSVTSGSGAIIAGSYIASIQTNVGFTLNQGGQTAGSSLTLALANGVHPTNTGDNLIYTGNVGFPGGIAGWLATNFPNGV